MITFTKAVQLLKNNTPIYCFDEHLWEVEKVRISKVIARTIITKSTSDVESFDIFLDTKYHCHLYVTREFLAETKEELINYISSLRKRTNEDVSQMLTYIKEKL